MLQDGECDVIIELEGNAILESLNYCDSMYLPEDRSAGGMREVAGSASPEGRKPSRIPEVPGFSPKDRSTTVVRLASPLRPSSAVIAAVQCPQVWPKIPNDRHELLSRGPFSSRCPWL